MEEEEEGAEGERAWGRWEILNYQLKKREHTIGYKEEMEEEKSFPKEMLWNGAQMDTHVKNKKRKKMEGPLYTTN